MFEDTMIYIKGFTREIHWRALKEPDFTRAISYVIYKDYFCEYIYFVFQSVDESQHQRELYNLQHTPRITETMWSANIILLYLTEVNF